MKTSENIVVVKSFGETEPFSRGKVYRSLKKAGVSGRAADDIVTRIEKGFIKISKPRTFLK
jgi:2-phosphoglycerate kinase